MNDSETTLRGVCQYRECTTNESQICSFPFKYKGRMYDSCITIDSYEPWCSLKIDLNRNHIESDGARGYCSSVCFVRDCPVGFYKLEKTCYKISAKNDHDIWTSAEETEKECAKVGARLYQPRDFKTFQNFLDMERNHLISNQSASLYRNQTLYHNLGVMYNRTSSSITYLDGSRAFMIEQFIKEQLGMLFNNQDEECIMIDQNGSLSLHVCNGYFDQKNTRLPHLGYICEAKNLSTIEGDSCIFPFKASDSDVLQTSCIFDDHLTPMCATEVDKNGVMLKNKWGTCLDERNIAFKGPGSGKHCVLPFVYNGIWRDTCIIEPHTEFWCPTAMSDFFRRFNESTDEIGFCTEHLKPDNSISDCSPNYAKVGNICLRVSPIKEDYETAINKCLEENGNLISVVNTNVSVNLAQHIRQLIDTKFYFDPLVSPNLTTFWVGGIVDNNKWTWISNSQPLSGDWVNDEEKFDCPEAVCKEKHGITISLLEDFKYKTELKISARPYICESKCRVGYRWAVRMMKCIKVVKKVPGVSKFGAMISCATENSRLVSINECEDIYYLTNDIWDLFPTAGEEYYIGEYLGSFPFYNMRRITELKYHVQSINSQGILSAMNCGWKKIGSSDSIGFIKYDLTFDSNLTLILEDILTDETAGKGYVCEEENYWVCPIDYVLFQEECYMLVSELLIFTEALMNCNSNKGHLAEPKHELHLQFLKVFINFPEINQPYWTGYRRSIFNLTGLKDKIITTSDFQENKFPGQKNIAGL